MPVSLGMGFISKEYEEIDPFQQLSPDTASSVQKSAGGFRNNNGNDDQESGTSLEGLLGEE